MLAWHPRAGRGGLGGTTVTKKKVIFIIGEVFLRDFATQEPQPLREHEIPPRCAPRWRKGRRPIAPPPALAPHRLTPLGEWLVSALPPHRARSAAGSAGDLDGFAAALELSAATPLRASIRTFASPPCGFGPFGNKQGKSAIRRRRPTEQAAGSIDILLVSGGLRVQSLAVAPVAFHRTQHDGHARTSWLLPA